MIEKTLHAGNIATAFALVATAADVTFTGGMTTAIGATLSGVALFKTADREAKTLAKSMANEMQKYLDNSSLTDGRKKIAAQMLKMYPPSDSDLAKGNMDAATIAANMRVYVNAKANDPAYKTDTALDGYADILATTLGPFLEPGNPAEAALQVLLARSDEAGEINRLKGEGITERAIIRLAQRIAGETDDLGQAWLALQDAMDTAVRVQQEGRIKSNHGDFVDTVLARVAELARDGDYSDASRAIDAALGEEEAAHARRKERLLASGVELARLDGDAARAAALLLQQADLAAGGQAEFEGLRKLLHGYYEAGRDKGIALDLSIAIEMARLILTRTISPDERGTALNDLGNALRTLGERETGTQRLQEAVTAYENALKERTRERVPLDWAMTQMNLGNALLTLGERESGTQRLQEAVIAYENALKEFTRERVPLDWAMTQMNLGNALLTLGERESGTQRLQEAVIAYENALKERTRERVPLQWAMTQMNLGNALRTLGERESGTQRLQEAVIAYESALKERTRDRVPLDWATTQMNLGNALRILGERETGTGQLQDAVTAFENALKEFTRDRVPLDWATTQMNLGNALLTLGARESGTQRLQEAVIAFENALTENTRERVPLQWAMTKANLANLELVFFDKTGEAAHLERGLGFAGQAKEVFQQAQASQYMGVVENIIAEINALRQGDDG